jgi:hypothetical protein
MVAMSWFSKVWSTFGDMDSQKSWDAGDEDGPQDEVEYAHFLERFGDSAYRPDGKLKRPEDFTDFRHRDLAEQVWREGKQPRGLSAGDEPRALMEGVGPVREQDLPPEVRARIRRQRVQDAAAATDPSVVRQLQGVGESVVQGVGSGLIGMAAPITGGMGVVYEKGKALVEGRPLPGTGETFREYAGSARQGEDQWNAYWEGRTAAGTSPGAAAAEGVTEYVTEDLPSDILGGRAVKWANRGLKALGKTRLGKAAVDMATDRLGRENAARARRIAGRGVEGAVKGVVSGETDPKKIVADAVAGAAAQGASEYTEKMDGPSRRSDVSKHVQQAPRKIVKPLVERGLEALGDRREQAPSSLDYVTTAQGLHDWIAKVGPTRAAEELRQSGRKPLEIRAIMEDHSNFDYPAISEEKIDEVTRPRPSGAGYGLYGPPWRRPMVQ